MRAVLLLALLCTALAGGDFLNTKVKRRIDLSSALVRTRVDLTVKSLADESKSVYKLAFPDAEVARTAFFQVKSKGTVLQTSSVGSLNGFTVYAVKLEKALAKNDTTELEVTTIQSHALTPKPAEIAQRDSQLVLYSTNAYISSPYTTKRQETIFTLPSSSVTNYTKVDPVSVQGSTLSYGPYNDVQAYSGSPVTLHFTNNAPFATFTDVQKEIEVSHWGNIAVEEQVDLQHTGAILKGGFSRLDHQMLMGPSASFRALSAKLPTSARDIYYRDIIGNISTSHVRYGDDSVEFEIETRFPMFGGWKTQWYQGYNVPSATFLSSDGSSFLLKVPFGVPFDSVITDKISVKVILPETSTVTNVKVPAALTRGSDEVRYTYLDTPSSGRTVLTFTGTNIVAENNEAIEVTYTTAPASLVREPLMLVTGFFALFIGYMVISRVNLSV